MQRLRGWIERDGQSIIEDTEITLDAPEKRRLWHAAFTASTQGDRVRTGEKYTVVLEDGRKGDCLITDQDTSVVGAPEAPHVVAVGLQPLYKV